MSQVRTVGVEEELVVVDSRTCRATSRAHEVLREHHQRHRAPGPATDDLDAELFRHQLEIRTDPTRDIGDLLTQVRHARRTAGEAVAARDLALAACATVPGGLDEPQVTSNDRYRDMLATFGDVARLGSTCGMHVHVGITSEDEGVGALDRIAPWLPVLLAVSANSPFTDGHDTGYASWRTQMWRSWPSAGQATPYGDVAGYHRACDRMIASGAARDRGMLYWDARLSDGQPTLEVRILDAVTDPEDTALLAALVRALVTTAADQWAAGDDPWPWRAEELRAATWRAARFGLADRLLDPATHELAPAGEVLGSLRVLVDDSLRAAGDADRVDAGIERTMAATGSTRQRAAYERTGSVEGVVADLVDRTAASWA